MSTSLVLAFSENLCATAYSIRWLGEDWIDISALFCHDAFQEGRLLSKFNMHWTQVYTVVSHIYIDLVYVD